MRNLLQLLPLYRSARNAADSPCKTFFFIFLMLTIPFGNLLAQCTPPGDTAVYGDHAWNVYAFNAGADYDNGQSWKEAYSGYYTDPVLNLNTQNQWGAMESPSNTPGYVGCPVNNDFHSWIAKRKGFPCGSYQINITSHDDLGQLFVNGIKVWEHGSCCDSHTNVWSGILNDSSAIVFRVTEGVGGSHGALELVSQTFAVTPLGPTTICPGFSLLLDGGPISDYLWSTGETTRTISVSTEGEYAVTIGGNGCTLTDTIEVAVAPLDTPELLTTFSCPGYGIGTSNYNSSLSYSWDSPNADVDASVSAFSAPGNYVFTATDALGCSASSHFMIAGPTGESDFGDWVWKVNGYAHGSSHDAGTSWKSQDFTGYYLDSALNFDSGSKWNENTNPSTAGNYSGCTGFNDHMSWSAKRRGFECGIYRIDVMRHDDEAQLFIDGVKVWQEVTVTYDPRYNVWKGILNQSSKVELRVTDGVGASNGALNFTYLGTTDSMISVTGNAVSCAGQFYTLHSIVAGNILWSGGEITDSIQVTQTGDYSLSIEDTSGCAITSQIVSLTIHPEAAPVAHITASSPSICNWNFVTLVSDSSSGNEWSTNETTQNISVGDAKVYTLKVTNSLGCFDETYISLRNEFTPPAPIASSNGPVCTGAAVNLVASGLAPGGQAASFHGDYQWIYVEQEIPEYDYTIEMWVKTTATEGGIFSAQAYPIQYNDRALYLENGQLNVHFYNQSSWNTGFTINDGKWHHIALVVQTGVGQMVYIDGISSGVGSTSDHSDYAQIGFGIGLYASTWDGTHMFNGLIDNVRIWSVPRTESEIRNNMMIATPASAAGLIYLGMLDGNLNATVGNQGYAYFGVDYSATNNYTYTWTGTGAPSPSTSETQTTSPISGDGVYTVSASGCLMAPSSSTSVSLTTLSVTANPVVVCPGGTSQLVATLSDGSSANYSWSPALDPVYNPNASPNSTTTYSVTVTNAYCNLSGSITVATPSLTSEQAVYGDHIWNVYVFNSGDDTDDGHSWIDNYSGYYLDSALDFNTTARWSPDGSPSQAAGYTGCTVNSDYHSWTAKRRGFATDIYTIHIAGHDGEGQLFVNGVKVWEHASCCDVHPDVWQGVLTDTSTVEFRVTEGVGESLGALQFNTSSYTYYADNDADSYGNAAVSISSGNSTPPSGYVSNSDDCNDSNASIHPGVTDLCNSIDDNCNGLTDENTIYAIVSPIGNVSGCKGTPLIITANTGSGILYQWYKNGKIINGATTSAYTVKKNGNYNVQESYLNCSSTSGAVGVTINATPIATITHGSLDLCGTGSVTLTANSGSGLSYQWTKANVSITGATNQTYTATKKASYKVVVTSANGCSKTSAGVKVTKSCRADLTEEELTVANLNIYPNPSHGQFVIKLELEMQEDEEAEIQIFNSLGQQVYAHRTGIISGKLQEEVNSLSRLPSGNYFVRVIVNEKVFNGKIMIQ